MKTIIKLFTVVIFFSFAPENILLVNTFPYTSDFETEALCGTTCTNLCNLTGGWKNAVQYGIPTTATTMWLAEDGSTPSTATGPDVDHTLGTATGKYLYVEASGCNNVTADLVSDQLDFTSVTTPAVEFWYHMYGAFMGTMQVDVSTDGGANFTNVEAPFTDNVDLWQKRRIPLNAYAGMSDVRIRVRAITGTSFTSDMAIDDILVFDCSALSIDVQDFNLVSNNCFLTNNETLVVTLFNSGCIPMPAGTSFDLSYTLNGGLPVTQNFVLTLPINVNSTQDFTFTTPLNLTGGGDQVINSSLNLAGNISSNISHTETLFSGVIAFPYSQDFESGAAGWTVESISGSFTSLELGTPTKPVINSAHSGVNTWVTNATGNYSDNENGAVVSPCFDMQNLLDANFAMWIWYNCEFSWDGAVLQSSIDGKNTWQNVGNFGDPNNWYTDNTIAGNPGGSLEGWSGRISTGNGSGGWVLAEHDVSHLVGLSPVYFRIAYGTDGSVTDDGFAFDDINITGTITCPTMVIESVQAGDYNDPLVWGGCQPTNPVNENVVINLNHPITIPAGYTLVNKGTMNATQPITNNGTIKGTGTMTGTLINNGVVSPGL